MIKADILKRGWTESLYQNFLSNQPYATVEKIEQIELSDAFRKQVNALKTSKVIMIYGLGFFAVVLSYLLTIFLGQFDTVLKTGLISANEIVFGQYVVFFSSIMLVIASYLTVINKYPLPLIYQKLGLTKKQQLLTKFSSNLGITNLIFILILFPCAIIFDLVSSYVYAIPTHIIQALLAPIASTMTSLYLPVAFLMMLLLSEKDMDKTYQNYQKSLSKQERLAQRKSSTSNEMKKSPFLSKIMLWELMALPYLLVLFSKYTMN